MKNEKNPVVVLDCFSLVRRELNRLKNNVSEGHIIGRIQFLETKLEWGTASNEEKIKILDRISILNRALRQVNEVNENFDRRILNTNRRMIDFTKDKPWHL